MKSISILDSLPGVFRAGLAALLVSLACQAQAYINGWEGDLVGTTRTFTLVAKHDVISTSDGASHYAWGYAPSSDLPMQYPGPTLIAKEGDVVRIVLSNTLPVPVSIVLPGQQGVTATCADPPAVCVPGALTLEARGVTPAEFDAGTEVAGPTYTFIAGKPGTYLYQSGTSPDLQIEMGLVGALIVRPNNYLFGNSGSHDYRRAYAHDGTKYDRENLFLLTEIDPAIHWQVYTQVYGGQPVAVDTTVIKPSIWFINGRNAPDTMLEDHVDWLPTQPYNALPRMHAGERLLMRVVNAGRDLHPFHHHGNHAYPIARDGRLLESIAGAGPDLTSPDFTVRSIPGQTMDLIFEWTGKGIGWDVYGTNAINPHQCNGADLPSDTFDPNTKEWCGDHNKPIPVIIPGSLDLSFGESWSGSPYLGLVGALPQGHPGLNTTGGYFQMWHSHNEKEITTDDIFPGGMMTMLIIEPRSVVLFEDLP